jgi:hypothetical protein
MTLQNSIGVADVMGYNVTILSFNDTCKAIGPATRITGTASFHHLHFACLFNETIPAFFHICSFPIPLTRSLLL